MKVIGLTGSIAMGKSEVAAIFARNGIPVFDADKEVHALYDSPAGVALLSPFVPGAIAKGRIDRQKLTTLVMADPQLLNKLETLVHKEIATRRAHFLAEMKAQKHELAVVDVPLLFETGGDKHVDVTIVVSAPAGLQKSRAMLRPGMTPDKLDKILNRQMPDAEKRQRADIIIENNGSLAALQEKVEAIMATLKQVEPS